MIDHIPLDRMKKDFLLILNQKSIGTIDTDNLSINYNDHLDKRLKRYLTLLCGTAELLADATENGDEMTTQAALLRIRSHSMSLSSFFEAITEDAEVLLHLNGWTKIPDNYIYPSSK
ncbi:hypothetical protein LG003_13705 [Photorhabdus kleinii]|uniref:hypothetical protein n=1 Tax=Photorhabdus kleinii TaxID=768034 RepID=UPI0021D4F4C8|nr:hypothetical protein [Photorhabdus kleinii]MCT8343873.1 hypothetical protein [Photorhabdus kleinii]